MLKRWLQRLQPNPQPRPPSSPGGQPGQPVIDLRQVVKIYETPAGSFTALNGIDLQVEAGEFVAVIGKSGSGKSTLINTITGIDQPTLGEVIVSGAAIHALSEDEIAMWRGFNMGVIFQFFQLLPTLTLVENVMLPMEFCRLYTPAERREEAMYLLELVEMVDQANKLPSTISGGQQQRVAIARALANNPGVLVADEPTGSLDSKTADTIFQLFENLVGQGKTILMVTHDRDLASRVSRVVLIADGEIVDQYVSSALHTLDRQQLVQIASRLEPETYPAGSTIFQQGDLADRFYIIIRGQVEVVKQHPSGREIISARLESGQYFGEIGLLQGGQRTATVRVAAGSEAAVLGLDRDTFSRLVTDSAMTYDAIAGLMRQRISVDHLLTTLPDLNEAQLSRLHDEAEVLTYAPGAIIIRRGEPAEKFYLITRGEVEVLRPGREDKPVARLTTGQYFGEIGLLRNSRRTATVRAALDLDTETEVMALDRAAFSRLINDSQMTKDEIAMVMRQRMLSTYETFLPRLRGEARDMLLNDKDDD